MGSLKKGLTRKCSDRAAYMYLAVSNSTISVEKTSRNTQGESKEDRNESQQNHLNTSKLKACVHHAK